MDVITRTIVATEAIYSEISFSPDGDVIASPLQSARFPGELTKPQIIAALAARSEDNDKNYVIRNTVVSKKRYAISVDNFLRYAEEMPIRGNVDDSTDDEDTTDEFSEKSSDDETLAENGLPSSETQDDKSY